MAQDIINQSSTFLTDTSDRKEVKPSQTAIKAIARAPLNMAIYKDDQPHPVLAHVLLLANAARSTYFNQWNALLEKWKKADEMYWMKQKESRMPEMTRAKVSASVFHRVVRRLADGAYLASWSEDMPVKFFPDISVFDDPATKTDKATIAEGLNRVALQYMKKNGMKMASKKSFLNVYKYGNHIVHTPWEYKVEKRKSYQEVNVNESALASDGTPVFRHNRTGDVSMQPHAPEMYEVEKEEVVADWVGYRPLNIDQFLLDNRIDCLDRQTFFFMRDDMTRDDIFSQARVGMFKNVERISEAQKFDPNNPYNQAELTRITDAGKTINDTMQSEMYERWQVWMLLPKIEYKTNKKGEVTDMEWDQNAEPCRYVMDVIGSPNGNCVVTRFSESPYWGKGIPFIDAHSHEDDSGWYHRGLQELLEDNMLQEQVAKGQLMDNRTLLNFRPLIRQVGRVKNKDMRITHNTVFDVTSPDALKWMDIPDFTANLNNSLEYLSKDSESVAQTPPFMIGEALGGRTSATEFASIRDQSSAPALNDIKNLNLQLFGGWMKKVKEYVPQFLDKDVAIQIAGQKGAEMIAIIHPDEFKVDLSVDEFAVQEFQNKSTMQQIMINLAQILGANPLFAASIVPQGFLERFFQQFNSIFPNPEEIIRKDPEMIAMIQQWISQQPVQGGGQAQGGGQPQLQMGGGMPPPQMAGQTEANPMNAVMGSMKGA
jgi:hypothetical protein